MAICIVFFANILFNCDAILEQYQGNGSKGVTELAIFVIALKDKFVLRGLSSVRVLGWGFGPKPNKWSE